MKIRKVLFLMAALCMLLSACGQKSAPTADVDTLWQEQYDLGVRYLSEGNYEEAILAFSAAIEIDPKQPEAYIGLADSYIGQGETSDALEALKRGYEFTQDGEIKVKMDQLLAEMEQTEEMPSLTNEAETFLKQLYAAFEEKDYAQVDDFLESEQRSEAWGTYYDADCIIGLCYDGEQISRDLSGQGVKNLGNMWEWYWGELESGVPSGVGVYFDLCGGYDEPGFENARHYLYFEGNWRNGLPDGIGTETYYIANSSGGQDCSITEGMWTNGLQEGAMTLYYYTDGQLADDHDHGTHHYFCESGKVIDKCCGIVSEDSIYGSRYTRLQ